MTWEDCAEGIIPGTLGICVTQLPLTCGEEIHG